MTESRPPTAGEVVRIAAQSRWLFPYGGFEALETAELQVLLAVIDQPKRAPAEIAVALRFTRNSISQPLTSLEAAGLITVVGHPSDGRMKSVSPTRSGRALCRRYLGSLGPE